MSIFKSFVIALILMVPLGTFAADSDGDNAVFTPVLAADSPYCKEGLDDNFIMQSFSIFTAPGKGIAEWALSSMFGKCATDRFAFKEVKNEQSLPHIIMGFLDKFHAIYFILAGALVLPFHLLKIARDHYKAHKKIDIEGQEDTGFKGWNWSFFMQNFVMLTFGIGFSGMYTIMSAAMLVGGYSSSILMTKGASYYSTTSKTDEGVTYKKTMKMVGAETPIIVAQRIQAHLKDLEVGTAIYSVYGMEQTALGVYREKPKKVVGENTFDRVAECLAEKVGEPNYSGDIFVNEEQEKTARCVKETGVADVTVSRLNYQGDSQEIRDALIPLDARARKVAAMIKEVTCSNFLNKNDNRNKYKDEVLVYKQCVSMDEHGVVAKKDGIVQLYDSAATQEQIDSEFKSIVADFNAAIAGYVDTLQSQVQDEVANESKPQDMISTAISMSTSSSDYVNDVSNIVSKELSQIVNTDNQTSKVGDVVSDLTGFSKQSDNYLKGKRDQVINFDLAFDRTIQPLVNAESRINVYSNVLFNMLTVNYYEDIGVNFKDCFVIDAVCIPPRLNQAASQYKAAESVLDRLTYVYMGLKITSIFLQQSADSGVRKGDTAQLFNSLSRKFEQAATYVQVFISFQIVACLLQSAILYMALIFSLMKWAYNFWITYIKFLREMSENMAPKNDEFNKHNMLMSIAKKNIWLALAPNLSVALFFVNSAAYALILTLSATYVYWIAEAGVDSGALASIFNLIIHATLSIIVTTSLLPVLVWNTNKIYKVIEGWFEMPHSGEGAQSGLDALQKLEGKLKAHLPSKI